MNFADTGFLTARGFLWWRGTWVRSPSHRLRQQELRSARLLPQRTMLVLLPLGEFGTSRDSRTEGRPGVPRTLCEYPPRCGRAAWGLGAWPCVPELPAVPVLRGLCCFCFSSRFPTTFLLIPRSGERAFEFHGDEKRKTSVLWNSAVWGTLQLGLMTQFPENVLVWGLW